jgi:hypothetical protein
VEDCLRQTRRQSAMMGPHTKVVPGDGDLVARCRHGGATPGGHRRDAGGQVVYRSTGGTGGQLVGDADGNGQVDANACRGKKVWAEGGGRGGGEQAEMAQPQESRRITSANSTAEKRNHIPGATVTSIVEWLRTVYDSTGVS